jgi:hypothetical protein
MFIPKYIRKARAKYSTLIVNNALYREPIPIYQSKTAKIATVTTTCITILRILLVEL